jgi:hypothetical protein
VAGNNGRGELLAGLTLTQILEKRKKSSPASHSTVDLWKATSTTRNFGHDQNVVTN